MLSRAVTATIWGEFARELSLPLCTRPASYACCHTLVPNSQSRCSIVAVLPLEDWQGLWLHRVHDSDELCRRALLHASFDAAVKGGYVSEALFSFPPSQKKKNAHTKKKRRRRVACVLGFEVKDYSSVPSENFVWGLRAVLFARITMLNWRDLMENFMQHFMENFT